ncbi:hypothetical protein F7725_025462 [Dissostichus mawsoni]|uniref:DRBM domain-containing protein n=1 Tax=Dissostichus mawsoni TaxID=36200 RepID=A0A7J5XD87_DISMA|nr:hypothetical protein F7725_025462 [Dissostichus mawsoni]
MESENYVGRLNEYAHKRGLPVDYRESPPDGPDQFTQRVSLNGIVYPEGVGKTKREAKKEAAKNALRDLSEGTHQTADDNYNPTPAQQNFIGLVNDYCMIKKCCHTFDEVRTDGQAHIRQLIIDNNEYPVAEGVCQINTVGGWCTAIIIIIINSTVRHFDFTAGSDKVGPLSCNV